MDVLDGRCARGRNRSSADPGMDEPHWGFYPNSGPVGNWSGAVDGRSAADRRHIRHLLARAGACSLSAAASSPATSRHPWLVRHWNSSDSDGWLA